MADQKFTCLSCGTLACSSLPGGVEPPAGCPMEAGAHIQQQARERLGDEGVARLARESARVEAAGYCRWTRIEEIMEFARRLGVGHIGIACCVGLRREAAVAQKVFEAGGFEVSAVICKTGAVPKEEAGLADSEKVRPGQFEALCNPVAQALLLKEAGCGLNVVIGLCVGHDSLFFQHSAAPCTVLVAKDRVLAHNPCAALYTASGYYKRLLGK